MNSYIYTQNPFPNQSVLIPDMFAHGTELDPNGDAIGGTGSLPDNVAAPQSCSCATAEYVLDLQIRVANLGSWCSRLANLEANFDEL